MAEGILVFGEASGDGAIDGTTAELLGAGQKARGGSRGRCSLRIARSRNRGAWRKMP